MTKSNRNNDSPENIEDIHAIIEYDAMPYPYKTDSEGKRWYQDMTQEHLDFIFNMGRDEY